MAGTDFEMLQKWGRVAKVGVGDVGFLDGQQSRSCDMWSEVLERVEVRLPTIAHPDVDERRLEPLEVRECAVEIVAGQKLET